MKLPEINKTVSLKEIEAICREHGLIALWNKIEAKPPKNPFSSDGCSCWFDRWDGIDMYPACFLHDLKYWAGGSDTDRLIADLELALDIAKLDEPEMAQVMLTGVRMGGGKSWRKVYSWGFGHEGN